MYLFHQSSPSVIFGLAILFFPSASRCQFPPTPEGLTVVKSQLEEGVTISYKEV
jgi:hypothetical protein